MDSACLSLLATHESRGFICVAVVPDIAGRVDGNVMGGDETGTLALLHAHLISFVVKHEICPPHACVCRGKGGGVGGGG